MTESIENRLRRHAWADEKRIAACDSPDGCDRTERTCSHENCGLVKITVHAPAGYPYRKWRLANGNEFRVGATPPCGVLTTAEVPFQ